MRQTETKSERLISESEAANLIGVSKRTIQSWRAMGTCPFTFVKIGPRLVKTKLSEVEDYIQNKFGGDSNVKGKRF